MSGGLGIPEVIVITVVFFALVAFVLWPYSKIFSKAGYSGWLAALMLVPGVNLVLLFWFALADWPVLRRARE